MNGPFHKKENSTNENSEHNINCGIPLVKNMICTDIVFCWQVVLQFSRVCAAFRVFYAFHA